jgi:hypothetical protein
VCRRFAGYATDEHTERVPTQMTAEAEADIHKFQDRSSEQDNDSREA